MNNRNFGTALVVLITFPLRPVSLQAQIQHGCCWITLPSPSYCYIVGFGNIKRVGPTDSFPSTAPLVCYSLPMVNVAGRYTIIQTALWTFVQLDVVWSSLCPNL
jgi:hypothetical protein